MSAECGVADCGVSGRNFEDLQSIPNGEQPRLGDFPWAVALYKKNAETGLWEHYCGGTLITPHIVLTAALCVVLKGSKRNTEDIQVGLGKVYYDYYHIESTAALLTVREVVVPDQYIGAQNKFKTDIALLDLDVDAQLSTAIRPACLDLSDNFHLRDNFTGFIVGWGMTENGKRKEYLQWARQRYLSYTPCLEKLKKEFSHIPTSDKSCIIDTQGTSYSDQWRGSAGSAFTTVRDGVHTVYGIIFSAVPFDFQTLLITDLTQEVHRTWIRDQCHRLTRNLTVG
uniref:Peptidase S1 domain-containing protein n=1 Tax=Graphocephala atropunctata TaxID=36148 RepID=A0A1B6LGX6_9HEMI